MPFFVYLWHGWTHGYSVLLSALFLLWFEPLRRADDDAGAGTNAYRWYALGLMGGLLVLVWPINGFILLLPLLELSVRWWGGDRRALIQFATVATNTAIAGAFGAVATMFVMMMKTGKPDPGMMANGMLAGLVAITAPCAFTSPAWSAVIGIIAGVLVIFAVSFVENVLKIDDPVGTISVHGICGTFGVLAVGIFANGSYGGAWNGSDVTAVEGVVNGKFGQLGVAHLTALDESGPDDALFNITRLRSDFGANSIAGLTFTNRDLTDSHNRVLAGDFRYVWGLYYTQFQYGWSFTSDAAG